MKIMFRKSALLLGALVAVAVFVTPPEVNGQTLATVAVVDINQVYNTFYRDSQAVRDLERLRREYQEEINSHVREMENLRDRRLQAQRLDNQRRVAELDEQILELQRFLEDLTRRRRQQLESSQNDLLSDAFLRQLQEAIQFVAESQGYTTVIRSDSPGLQWWSAEVDISDLVLQRLNQTTNR